MVQGIPALLATLGALAATGLLILRAKNARLPYLIAWCLTLVGISFALVAMTLGFLFGFGGLLFRVMEVGGALLGPVWLALGMSVLITRVPQLRFVFWLSGISYTVVAVVILLLDPLKGSFTDSLPDPGRHYDTLPLLLIDVAHAVAVIALVACTVMLALRAGKQDRDAYEQLMPVALVALAGVLVVSGTRGFLPGVLAVVALAGAAGLVWFGATRTLPPAAAEDDAYEDYDDEYAGREREYAGEEYAAQEYAGQEYRGQDHPEQVYAEQGYGEQGYVEQEYVEGYGEQAPGFPDVRTGYDEQPYAAAPGPQIPPASPSPLAPPFPPPLPQQPPGMEPPGRHAGGRVPTGERPRPTLADLAKPPPPPQPTAAPPLCGQITVYTLLDGRGEAFDRVVSEAVRAAREAEPDTLIFACHEVTGAPTQRIVYQLFRDQAAFAEHQRLPHVQRFAAESRPFVLTTNVIELNLTSAKVVPLPSPVVRDHL
ncbi:putative quinol monooxygenase [Thermomonospora umbrina]|uniref:Quinol monooxygenase YgiN n=1 Tax=Thermomonospora umbrina TaxID=111806 RepID=A0A3D9SZL0_9ACTN|nr:antibiotic biosynthesis monooxygenase [Thermomonospora umbrina]REE98004.1 quinol monooxygenase YgiN [Thermomonospora umbrina]